MSISSVNNTNWATLLSQYSSPYANAANNSTTTTSNDTSSAINSVTGVNSTNSDGDTFQLSGTVPLEASAYNNTSASSSITSTNLASDITSLLAEIKNGTATTSDIQNIENELQQYSSTSGTDSSSTVI